MEDPWREGEREGGRGLESADVGGATLGVGKDTQQDLYTVVIASECVSV